MAINPLQLPGPLVVPRVDFTPLSQIGDTIIDQRRQQQEAAAIGDYARSLSGSQQPQQPQQTAQPMPVAAPPGGQLPRGLRNNNPGNIEDGPLAKSLPGYKGSDGRFAIFDTPDNGLNAMDALLTSYGRRGLKTVRDVISRWAPASDNNPVEAYARYAGNGNPDAPIDLSNREARRELALRMARFENGMVPQSEMQPPQARTIPPEVAARIERLAKAGPEGRKLAIALIAKYEGKQEPIKLGPGDVIVDPNTYRPLARAPDKAPADKGETIEQQVAARTRTAQRLGWDTKDPNTQEFIATGRRPGADRDSPTSLKMIADAEDENLNLQTTKETLTRALELNNQTFTGAGANIRRILGTKLWDRAVPDVIADPATAQATEEWQKLMEPEALQSMARTLKGATTDFELRTFVKQLADPETTPETRKKIIERMLRLADRNIQVNQTRMDQIRGKTYTKPGGGQSAPAAPAAPQGAGVPEGATATNPQTGQRIIFRGGKWQPM